MTLVGSRDWLVLSVTSAGAGVPSLRMFVWRGLRTAGALTLQPSVYLLPARPDALRAGRRIVDRVKSAGGQAQMLRMSATEQGDQDWLVEQMQQARDVEYAEVLDRLPSFFAELEKETGGGRVTFAEVEENEADLARFEDWLAKIRARDYFCAPRGLEVISELARAREALTAFEALALDADDPLSTPTAAALTRPLRAVPAKRSTR